MNNFKNPVYSPAAGQYTISSAVGIMQIFHKITIFCDYKYAQPHNDLMQ